jgi:hypothetical protein
MFSVSYELNFHILFVFIMEINVLCEVRTEFLHIISLYDGNTMLPVRFELNLYTVFALLDSNECVGAGIAHRYLTPTLAVV